MDTGCHGPARGSEFESASGLGNEHPGQRGYGATVALRPCIQCGRLSNKTRCPTHEAERERNRTQRPTNLTRDTTERKRRADAVMRHRHAYGDWCPGHDVPAHPSSDLTADHIISVANGGDPNGPLQVLCRSCNGRKSDHPGGGVAT